MSAAAAEQLPVGAHAVLHSRNLRDDGGVDPHKGANLGVPVRPLRHARTRPSASPWMPVVAATIASLTTLYLVLHCFHILSVGYRHHGVSRALAAGGSYWGGQCSGGGGEEGFRIPSNYGPGQSPEDWVDHAGNDGGESVEEATEVVTVYVRDEEGWENRDMPLHAQSVYTFYLNRISCMAGLVHELKTHMPRRHFLKVVFKIVKILVVELGVLSLNPANIESAREAAGQSLVELLKGALSEPDDPEEHIPFTNLTKSLLKLTKQVMKPRKDAQKMKRDLHKTRVVGSFRTIRVMNERLGAIIASLRCCLTHGVSFSDEDLDWICSLLDVLMEAICDRFLRDAAAMWHLLHAQMNIKDFVLFSRDKAFSLDKQPISPLKDFVSALDANLQQRGGLAYLSLVKGSSTQRPASIEPGSSSSFIGGAAAAADASSADVDDTHPQIPYLMPRDAGYSEQPEQYPGTATFPASSSSPYAYYGDQTGWAPTASRSWQTFPEYYGDDQQQPLVGYEESSGMLLEYSTGQGLQVGVEDTEVGFGAQLEGDPTWHGPSQQYSTGDFSFELGNIPEGSEAAYGYDTSETDPAAWGGAEVHPSIAEPPTGSSGYWGWPQSTGDTGESFAPPATHGGSQPEEMRTPGGVAPSPAVAGLEPSRADSGKTTKSKRSYSANRHSRSGRHARKGLSTLAPPTPAPYKSSFSTSSGTSPSDHVDTVSGPGLGDSGERSQEAAWPKTVSDASGGDDEGHHRMGEQQSDHDTDEEEEEILGLLDKVTEAWRVLGSSGIFPDDV
ncbi:hypothetical protein, conserved [Eimeria acervulina]|uniref:Uncharacterized protein n=1 Tax=Eimeria acervulina TaxID=5801 RepID=U6GNS9_EIMAC|nr:hypothetical protein, conserved [Eimeria acervulina]CDI81835.1 hypothetical protein, conserved [Eimeria acervulina]